MTLTERLIYNDALTMAFRLIGEDEATMSPECREVVARWRGECFRVLEKEAKGGEA
jgi:hypothetical protein